MIDDPSVSLGATESYPLPGITTLIRVEPRVWGRNENGDLVQGCFRSAGIYLPSGSPPAETAETPESPTNKLVGGLTVASLAVGIVATLASLGGSS